MSKMNALMNALNTAENGSCFGFCNQGFSDPSSDSITDDSSRLSSSFQNRHLPENHLLETAEDRQQKEEMDALLCTAMEGLSLEERKKEEAILRGAVQSVESASLVDRALEDLHNQLQSIKHNSMYEVAERINPDYVSARPFRVMFLRANEYDPKASAQQMLGFFDSKYQLFGIEKLVEDITLSDLSEEDLACLKMGCIQFAGRDKSGRQVFTHFAGFVDNMESWLRINYFMKMKALEDEETQLRGVILIWNALSVKSRANRINVLQCLKMTATNPVKKQGWHMCIGTQWQYVIHNTAVFIKVMQRKARARIQIHLGSALECQYALSTYGIPPQSLRLDPNGRIELQSHLRWIQSCAKEDSKVAAIPIQSRSLMEEDIKVCPRPNDVLFTGGTVLNQPGNQRYQSMVQESAQKYDEAASEERKQIGLTIIETIHGSGGRFLQRQQQGDWKELPHEEIWKKVTQVFRNHRRLLEASKRKGDESLTEGTLILGGPLPNDVIFGRAKRNAGTELLHRLIKVHSDEYCSLSRGTKMGLVQTIIQQIADQGGRFLQRTEGGDRWLEVSNETVKERISKYFRNHRRLQKKKGEK